MNSSPLPPSPQTPSSAPSAARVSRFLPPTCSRAWASSGPAPCSAASPRFSFPSRSCSTSRVRRSGRGVRTRLASLSGLSKAFPRSIRKKKCSKGKEVEYCLQVDIAASYPGVLCSADYRVAGRVEFLTKDLSEVKGRKRRWHARCLGVSF